MKVFAYPRPGIFWGADRSRTPLSPGQSVPCAERERLYSYFRAFGKPRQWM